ncbi:MAG: hypothetical protein DI585_02440 [Pseudomonas fluorescens]|nr:MAG: hypothetical protein DI585_02440 [Pseudomonas fluorescens]
MGFDLVGEIFENVSGGFLERARGIDVIGVFGWVGCAGERGIKKSLSLANQRKGVGGKPVGLWPPAIENQI